MMGKKVLALMLTMVMVLSLTACSACGGRTESVASASSQKMEDTDLAFDIVDCAGRTVHFKKPIETACVNFQGGSFFTMCALFGKDVADHLACWDGRINMWPDFNKRFYEQIPALESVPIVGDFRSDKLDVEKVITSHPDVAIFPLYNYKLPGIFDKVVPQLEAAGIPVVVTDYRRDELNAHLQSMKIIGKVFGKEARAKELADFYEANVNIIYSRVTKLIKKESPSVTPSA